MNKFIGEMSKEDFIDALKIILSTNVKELKKDSEEKDERTFKEKIQDKIKYIKESFKYIFSKRIFVDIYNNSINFIKEFFDNSKEEEHKITKEEFIENGLKIKAIIQEIVETVVFVLVMVILIRYFIGEIRWIPSGSMHPTLLEGDRVFVERYSRFYKTPNRGDIVVFYPPFETIENTPIKVFSRLTGFFCKDIAYIKRVIGLPGEKFEIKQDESGKSTVYINGKPLNEPYIQSAYEFSSCNDRRVQYCGPLVIPDKHYMMLGDNRGNSEDSRYWGFLPEDRIIGRAVFLFWPFTRVKTLDNGIIKR